MRSFDNSRALFEKGKNFIPGVSQTNSKRISFLLRTEKYPVFIDRGKNAHLIDIDGNEYIDFVMSLGPTTLGYSHPAVNEAIIRQLEKGTLFSFAHESEVELAELLSSVIPCAEMSRFFKTGAEGVAAAARLARSITGKEMILSSGYHGWHDWCSADEGVPAAVKSVLTDLPHNNIPALEKAVDNHKGKFAAIIINPYECDISVVDYLSKARQLATENNALLVFDEIVTGFRLSPGGAQQYFDVVPDLAVFAKGMANGMPIAALTGKREFMSVMEKRWITTTYGGEALSIAASIATIKELIKPGLFDHIYSLGNRLKDGLTGAAAKRGLPFRAGGMAPMSHFIISGKSPLQTEELCRVFHEVTFLQGVIFKYPHFNFICATHTKEDIETALNAAETGLEKIAAIYHRRQYENIQF